ncbi:hypothetical protein SEA_ATUIN_195 [Arthrobacter phage Atuin]|nr:hypothetical protein SEA_ATUIN_294 [Arthrobacter phage Atuin]
MTTATKAPKVIPNVEAPAKKDKPKQALATLKIQKLMEEAHTLKQEIGPKEARLEVIKEIMMAEMDRKGADLLVTKEGLHVVGRFEVTRWYAKSVEEFIEKWPKLAEKFLKKSTFDQINWKKPIKKPTN